MIEEAAMDAFHEENGRRGIEQLAIAAMSTAHKRFVEACAMDVCDRFKTPVDPVRVREGAGFLLSLTTLVNDA